MGIFDNEIEIIEFFRTARKNEVLLLPEKDKIAEKIYLSIVEEWDKWTNSSGKSDPPPDFFSDELGLMMDVMRVDDHGYIGRNGKTTVNPTLRRESEVMRELQGKGIQPFLRMAQGDHVLTDQPIERHARRIIRQRGKRLAVAGLIAVQLP